MVYWGKDASHTVTWDEEDRTTSTGTVSGAGSTEDYLRIVIKNLGQNFPWHSEVLMRYSSVADTSYEEYHDAPAYPWGHRGTYAKAPSLSITNPNSSDKYWINSVGYDDMEHIYTLPYLLQDNSNHRISVSEWTGSDYGGGDWLVVIYDYSTSTSHTLGQGDYFDFTPTAIGEPDAWVSRFIMYLYDNSDNAGKMPTTEEIDQYYKSKIAYKVEGKDRIFDILGNEHSDYVKGVNIIVHPDGTATKEIH